MPESNIPINKPLESGDDDAEPDPPLVQIANLQSRDVDTDRLLNVATKILDDHKFCRGNISLAIVDDTEIHRLNVQFLQHDYETDVLSFVFDVDAERESLNGEVIVSADTAERVAIEVGCEFQDELILYVIHGMLHLVGYDDKSDSARPEMRRAEAEYMQFAGAEYRQSIEDERLAEESE